MTRLGKFKRYLLGGASIMIQPAIPADRHRHIMMKVAFACGLHARDEVKKLIRATPGG